MCNSYREALPPTMILITSYQRDKLRFSTQSLGIYGKLIIRTWHRHLVFILTNLFGRSTNAFFLISPKYSDRKSFVLFPNNKLTFLLMIIFPLSLGIWSLGCDWFILLANCSNPQCRWAFISFFLLLKDVEPLIIFLYVHLRCNYVFSQ